MFVVDTNVLIYGAEKSCNEHAHCRDRINGWRGQAESWFLTWGIVYEFVRVTTHPRVFVRPWGSKTHGVSSMLCWHLLR